MKHDRCTSTQKHEWDTCPVKQVSADRLENFCIENLERISVDSTYLENLAYRLNNDVSKRPGRGLEVTGALSPFSEISADNLEKILNLFITGIKKTKGIDRNLLAKRSLEKIMYAPDC